MTPKVDQEKCIGCGACASIAADVFKINENDKVEVLSGDHSDKEEAVKQAKDACPVAAITIE